MLRIEQYSTDIKGHDLPATDAELCLPNGNPQDAYIEEQTVWAGTVKTPWPIVGIGGDNRGEPYRSFAVIKSNETYGFPVSVADAKRILDLFAAAQPAAEVPIESFAQSLLRGR
jgi:hypothetical protein